nr:hypothetical protein [Tanacetum cinerariifolium]
METLTVESPIPTASSPVTTACLNDSLETSSEARLVSKRVAHQEESPSLDNILSLTNKFDDILRVSTSSDEIIGVEDDRTKRVEENLHVEFLENKAIEKGAGLNWLFDIDSLTKSMNYVPVDAGTNATNLLGTKDAASQEVKKDVSSLRYIALPNWVHDALLKSSSSKPQDDCSTNVPESSGNSNPTATSTNPQLINFDTLTVETLIPTVSSPVPTACLNDSTEPSSDTRLISKRVVNQVETPSLDNILTLKNRFKDILGVTTNSVDSDRVEADVSNMKTTNIGSPAPTLRIHKDHPKSQIIGPVDTLIQTKNKSKEVLKNKKDERGIVIRNKARLVAQVHTQEEGIDYDEVFTPVARIEAIGLFLAYASFMGFTVYQMDVKVPFFMGIDKTGKDVDLHLYRSMIGSLMYLIASRPDIMFAVCACAMRQVTPKECHLHAVKRIFRYLKGHPKLGLWYPKESPFNLVSYSDSDYGDLLTKPFDVGRFRYLVCKLFSLLGKLSNVGVFLGFGLTFAGTSKYWGVLRILMISFRLIPLVKYVMRGFVKGTSYLYTLF